MDENSPEYWAPRICLRQPPPILFWAAALLEEAASFHLQGNTRRAASRLTETNNEEVRNAIEVMWGAAERNPEQRHYLRKRKIKDAPARFKGVKDRMPRAAEQRSIVARDGYKCRYCGALVIPPNVRDAFARAYPIELPWRGKPDVEKHAAFMALWLQFDHVVPDSRGGDATPKNVVISCAGCNYGKSWYMLEELGLTDPRDREPTPTSWNGLVHLLQGSAK